MNRSTMLKKLAGIILGVERSHPVLVAIDGVDGAGKTIFADELAAVLKFSQREVIRASVDGFHNPHHIRYQQGDLSPEGFYQDSYNYPAFIENLLVPLGSSGSREYRQAIFDVRQNQALPYSIKKASTDAIALIDGIFLLRPLLFPYWDLTIYIHADFAQTFARGAQRDIQQLGSRVEAEMRYTKRYLPGQKLYLQEANPRDRADILIDNNCLANPLILRIPQSSSVDERYILKYHETKE